MPLTLQEMSDRFEIMDLLTTYCTAIDSKNIDALDNVFSHNATIDYSRAGGPTTNLKAIKKFLNDNLGDLPRQHMISNFKIVIEGDHATSRCLCHNPLELPKKDDELTIAIWGLWYEDKLIRTPSGWRISHRETHPCYNWVIKRESLK